MANILSIFDTESAAEKGATLLLKHPSTGEVVYADKAEKKPLSITVKGIDSKEFESLVVKRARQDSKGKAKKDEFDVEKEKLRTCELYAKLTIGWENLPVDFSYDKAVEVYMQHKDIRVQVGNFMAERANFIES